MFTEDNLATAQIAQLFGSELLKVQQNAQTDSGATPDIVKINPKQFLINNSPQIQSRRRSEEQKLIQMLQQEAEAACPLPNEPIQTSPIVSSNIETPINSTIPTQTITSISSSNNKDIWEKINGNLERIANCMERVHISIKKKKTSRTQNK